jgi:hypothetical protein
MKGMPKRLQCKHIQNVPILQMLGRVVAFRGDGPPERVLIYLSKFGKCILDAMPAGVPEKLALAKLKRLIRRKLIEGCVCGCPGDFELTDEGNNLLIQMGLDPWDEVPKVVTEVFNFANGMTMVFDQGGRQMLHLQGRTEVVMPALRAMGFEGVPAELQMSTNMEDYA